MSLPLSYAEFCNSATLDDQVAVLDMLFEHTDSLVHFTVKNTAFRALMRTQARSYADLVALIRTRLLDLVAQARAEDVSSLKIDHLANIIAAHPRLGETDRAKLSVHSLGEQANLASATPAAEVSREKQAEMETLRVLNRNYEEKYTGLRFVCFVNGRARPEIIREMQERITSGNTWFKEAELSINAMCDIALDRLKKYSTFAPSL